MSFTQQNLQAIHRGLRDNAQLWASGLITDREFADYCAKQAAKFRTASHLMPGLLDPNTGLRYTSGNSHYGAPVSDDRYREMHERNHRIYGTAK